MLQVHCSKIDRTCAQTTVFKNFTKRNIRNTKNRSIRKVFKLKYKFTIKPVISCKLDSRNCKCSNITKKVRGFNDLREMSACSSTGSNDNLSLRHNFCAVYNRIFAVETVEYSLTVFLPVYRFEKMCFPSEKAILASEY